MAVKGAKLTSNKVSTNFINGFDTTVEFTILHCNNFSGNNNKFYCIEILENSDGEFALFSNYGRLGKTSVYEVRQYWKGTTNPITNLAEIKDEYDAIIAKKERGKKIKKGDEVIAEFYTKVDVLSPTVGSSNICKMDTIEIKQSAIPISSHSNSDINRILTQLSEDNIHDILSKTSMKLTSCGLETDVGIISDSHINKASIILDTLRDIIALDSADLKKLATLPNNEYFSLIPRSFSGMRLSESDMILTADKLSEEYDLLDGLRTALKVGLNKKDVNDSKINIDITYLEDKKVWDYFDTMYESSKHKNHSHLKNWKIKNIFNIKEKNEKINQYNNRLNIIGNELELFHGSKNTNILSIMVNSLFCPPKSAGHVTGRMFGDGIYAASCSTKALNYSTGYWDNSKTEHNAFMFIVKFAMGKIQNCKKFKYSGADSGYDSVHGLSNKSGGTLLNDEYIVYNNNQAIITHLLELTK